MKRIAKRIGITLGALAAAAILALAGLYWWAVSDLPRLERVEDYDPPLATSVYTAKGEVLGYFCRERRFQRSLREMSPCVPKAFIAAEDREFRSHPGVDLSGIVRAAIANLQAGRIVQGASTITQQVVDSLLMDTGTSYLLKLREAVLAYRLERDLSKNEILSIYLNEIYLGEGAYGVEAAARTYFGKHADELTTAEAALLAGLPKAPSLYNPCDNPDAARSRQRYVLTQMRNTGLIPAREYRAALEAELDFRGTGDPTWSRAPYYLQCVRRRLLERFSRERVYQGGLQVHTAVALDHNKPARRALRGGLRALSKRRGWRGPLRHLGEKELRRFPEGAESPEKPRTGERVTAAVLRVRRSGATVRFRGGTGFIGADTMAWAREVDTDLAPSEAPEIRDARTVLDRGDVVRASVLEPPEERGGSWRLALQQRPEVQGALVSMDPSTGGVKALIGGYSFSQSRFNRAVQAKRQPGSAFKPVVYSAALEEGFTAASPLVDAPVVMQGAGFGATWKPRNYSLNVRGKILLRTGLVHSINLATVRLARRIGIRDVIAQARSLGLEGPFPRDLTIAIGSLSVSPVNLCRAYSAFARDGTVVEPAVITRVAAPGGEVLRRRDPEPRRAMSPQVAYIMTELLRQAVQDGTGWRAKKLGRPVAGKTGTTNNQREAWFIGYTSNLLTAVYVGFDTPRSLGRYETGSRAASPVWLDYMRSVRSLYPERPFRRPDGVVTADVSAETGRLAAPGSGRSYALPFRRGKVPRRRAGDGSGRANILKKVF